MLKDTQAKFYFSNVVVVDEDRIGVIVKTWSSAEKGFYYEVYVREYNTIREYLEKDIKQFIHSKILSEEEVEFYNL